MRSSRVVPHPHLGLTELSVQEGGFRGWGVPYLGLTLAGEFVDDLKLREQPMRRERKIPLPARERLHRAHQRVVLLVFLFFFSLCAHWLLNFISCCLASSLEALKHAGLRKVSDDEPGNNGWTGRGKASCFPWCSEVRPL